MDSTLAHIDQASFLGLRALGHGPLIQFTWIYRRDVDLEALRCFHRNLGRGLIGRRIERSPLPFGRHRWITWSGPADIEVGPGVRPRSEIVDWTDEQAALPIDPEWGPSWRLAVQPLTEGGTAVTLVASHTVADGVGMLLAVVDAVQGVTHDLGYPRAGSRTKGRALLEDSARFVRDLPEMARAVKAAVHLARTSRDDVSQGVRGATGIRERDSLTVTVPSLTVRIDLNEWDRRAEELGGTSNSLFLGFATRLGRRLHWTAPDGSVTLSLPVNERIEGDTRGNALTGVRLTADPEVVNIDLTAVRAEMKAALSTLGEVRNELLAPLPLTPLVPKVVARRLEGLVVSSAVIGCSNLGDLDPAVNRPDGNDADLFAVRLAERITRTQARRSGGVFFPLASGRLAGTIFINVGYCDADGSTTREELSALVRDALDDMGLSGSFD